MTTPTPKYELLQDDTIEFMGRTLHRIRALRDFGRVKTGKLGGYVEGEANLSHEGTCWVADQAKVFDHARVRADAKVAGRAKVYGRADVSGDAKVYGTAWVGGKAQVFGKAKIGGNTVLTNGTYTGDAAASDANGSEDAAAAPGM